MSTVAAEPPAAGAAARPSWLPLQPPWLRLVARSTWRAVAWGLVAGVTGGTVYRAFMALLTPEPSFTWAGTLLIAGSVTIVTTLVAVTARARATWERRTAVGVLRVVTALSFVLLAQAQGMALVPAWLLGGLALGRVLAPPALRRIGLGLALLAVVAFVAYGFVAVEDITTLRLMAASALYVGIAAAHLLGFTAAVGSPPRR